MSSHSIYCLLTHFGDKTTGEEPWKMNDSGHPSASPTQDSLLFAYQNNTSPVPLAMHIQFCSSISSNSLHHLIPHNFSLHLLLWSNRLHTNCRWVRCIVLNQWRCANYFSKLIRHLRVWQNLENWTFASSETFVALFFWCEIRIWLCV